MTAQLLPDNAIEIYQGSSMTLVLRVKTPSEDNPNIKAPFDLTGSTVYLTVKKRAEDTNPLIHKASTDALLAEITNPRAGEAKFYISPGDTATLNAGDYEYDCWVTLSNGKRFPVIRKSTWRVLASVTRLSF